MPLTLISSDDLLERGEDALDWVIRPFCVRGSSMMIYARQGHGKSSIVTQLAHSLIHGTPWLLFDVCASGPVVYLQVDMPDLETLRMVQRADAAGLKMKGQLYFSLDTAEGEDRFDILESRSFEELQDLCAQVEPIAVIVDTINDVHVNVERGVDVNAVQRLVFARLKAAIGPDAVLIFLNHQRKSPKDDRGGENDDDFLGGGSWEQRVSSSLKLERTGRKTARLRLKKVRLDDKPFESMELTVDGHGFFHPKIGYMQMLTIWPDHLGAAEKSAEIAKLSTLADVCRAVGKLCDTDPATVRKYIDRHPGVDFPWRKYLASGS